MTKSSGFGSDARLKDGEEFRKVFRQGRKTSGRFVVLWHRLDDAGSPAKLGLSVSSKVGGAVRRNRLKRLLRESFRLRRASLPLGLHIVASPRSGCDWKVRADAERDFADVLTRSGAAKC